ncbi:MAG: rhomboid family intramembrane serine protease [Anaerolineales bacterium]|nr:rhomboid family intramembrane serine protease [Anaerolineales bacterium]
MNDQYSQQPQPDASNSNVTRVPVPRGGSQPPKTPSTPLVTYTLLGLTVIVYLLQMGTDNMLGYDLPAALGLKVNELIVAGQLWRLITPVLLHGSLVHIGFNMYALYLFGPRLENNFGHWRFLSLYLISGFAGNVFSMMFTQAPSLGSSTAIFGLLGAHGIFVYQNRAFFGEPISRAALSRIVQVAAINLIIGLSPGIDNWGHVGGLIGGTLFTWFGGPLLGVSGIHPNQFIADQRDNSDTLQAIAISGGYFIFLAAGALYLMTR